MKPAWTCLLALGLTAVLASAAGASVEPAGLTGRSVFLVPIGDDPSWHDLAYLACIPPAAVANGGRPAVLAIPADGRLPDYVTDYLQRYGPKRLTILGAAGKAGLTLPKGPAEVVRLKGKTLSDVTTELVRMMPPADGVVICDRDDYGLALSAAALAARLKCPLLFSDATGLDNPTRRAVESRKPKTIVYLGVGEPPKLPGVETRQLRNTQAVIHFLRDRKLSMDYFALANPNDRSRGKVRKLSLTAALLAAGRDGVVIPLPMDAMFKKPFTARRPTEADSDDPMCPHLGSIDLAGKRWRTIAYRDHPKAKAAAGVLIDGKGPYRSGDIVTLGPRRYSITLDGNAKATAVRLTRPTWPDLQATLQGYYRLAGRPPRYLCITGMPEAIPTGIYSGAAMGIPDVTSDSALAQADDDPFLEVAVGRLIGHNVCAAAVTAARSLTYPDLLTGPDAEQWKSRWLMAGWNITDFRWEFERAGLTSGHRHTRGKQPDLARHLTRSSMIWHELHSTWRGLGGFVGSDFRERLAPCLMVSGGCATAAIDTDPSGRSVAKQFLQQGAVAYVGSARNAVWCIGQMLCCFWDGVLREGMTVGQAFLEAQNVKQVVMLDCGGRVSLERYQFLATRLYGDPAWKPYVPKSRARAATQPTSPPSTYTLAVPQEGTQYAFMPPKRDWGYKKDDPLHNWRAGGLFWGNVPRRRAKHDRWRSQLSFLAARVRTAGHVTAVTQVTQPKLPTDSDLRWSGHYYVDEHADGTRTLRWLVPVLDFDMVAGKVRRRLPPLQFKIGHIDESETAARIVNVNFHKGTTIMNGTGPGATVAPRTYVGATWNDIRAPSLRPDKAFTAALRDSRGRKTDMGLSIRCRGHNFPYRAGEVALKAMRGYWALGPKSVMTLTVNGLKAGEWFDVYLLAHGGGGLQFAEVTWIGRTLRNSDKWPANATTFAAGPAGNYLRLTGKADKAGTLTLTLTNPRTYTALAALQIAPAR